MRCYFCSSENPPENRFCGRCGRAFSVPCPGCGFENPTASQFCGSCGLLVAGQRRGAIEAQPGWGELKHATVLIADIVSSTELVAGLDAEQAMERLRPAVMTMSEAVVGFDGVVVRTLGDGIMALFGAPTAREDHALMACEAALAMRDALRSRAPELAIRVGLHSGEVLLDAEFAKASNERLAHGLALHLASRVQALAEPGNIYLSEACYQLVEHQCDTEPLGRYALRGLSGTIAIFGLSGVKPAAASQQFRGVALASFHGRDAELGLLDDGLRRVEAGSPLLIGITGAPGAGKSRLCFEFAERCRVRRIPVFEARAQPSGHARPLQPILELLRSMFGILAADSPAVAQGRVTRTLQTIDADLAADAPLMCEFLGVPIAGEQTILLQPSVRRARLLKVVRAMVRHGSASGPAVFIIEDLHWLDDASGDYVAAFAEAVVGTKALLVVNYRLSFAAAWLSRPEFRAIELPELDARETESLVRELLGDRPELADLRRRVADRSAGNPFYAEELVRSLAESGTLVGEPGGYRSVDGGAEPLPATVQAVIGARIDRLAEPEKSLLQIGAIIGKEIPRSVLAAVASRPAASIDASLELLCDGGLLQSHPATAGSLHAFRHPLIQEVAYATQLRARRSGVHAAVARAMQDYHRSRLDENAALIAFHYEAAGENLNSARYESRAAIWVGATNTAQAIKHWRKVRSLLLDQPRTAEADRLRILASAQIGWLGWREGLSIEEDRPLLTEALGWARETGDSMISLLLLAEGRIAGASGGPADHYVALVQEALSLIDPAADPGRAATLNAALSQAYGWAGLFADALVASDAALKGITFVEPFDHQFLGYSAEHWIMSLRGRILVQLGRFAEAEACFDFMLGIDQRLVNPTVQFIVHLGHIDLAWCRDDAAEAARHAARVAEIAERHGSRYLVVFAHACRGIAHSVGGDHLQGASEFRAGLRYLREVRAAMDYEADLLAYLAEAQLAHGLLAEAEATAREAVDVARRLSARMLEMRALIACGSAMLRRHGPAAAPDAARMFDDAEKLLRLCGARIYDRMLQRAQALLEAQTSRC